MKNQNDKNMIEVNWEWISNFKSSKIKRKKVTICNYRPATELGMF